MIGRSDQLSGQDVEALKMSLSQVAEGVPVIAVSPKTGKGVDEALGYIESPMIAGRRLLEIDYDIYAAGEAELGWVNLTVNFETSTPIDLDRFAAELVGGIAEDVIQNHDGAIAHLKASILAGDTQAVANVVSNQSGVDVGLAAGRSVTGPIQVIVNARVAIDPDRLQHACESNVRRMIEQPDGVIKSISAHSLRPGRPTPTHRVTSAD
jgi:hypothetical protein